MDRLARSLGDLLATVQTLNEKGVKVRFVRENLSFELGADFNCRLLGAMADSSDR